MLQLTQEKIGEDWVSFVDNRTNYAEEMPAETPSQRDGLLIDASKRKRAIARRSPHAAVCHGDGLRGALLSSFQHPSILSPPWSPSLS